MARVEPLKERLYEAGAAAVVRALDALEPPTPAAAEVIRTTRAYFAEHTARMDYPRFVAQHLPIGSGAIESLRKGLIAEREKGAGMRWTGSGAQAVASLRALHRSGDWAAFWQRHPCHPLRLIPRQRSTAPAAPPVSSAAPGAGAPCASSSPSQPVDAVPAPIPAPVARSTRRDPGQSPVAVSSMAAHACRTGALCLTLHCHRIQAHPSVTLPVKWAVRTSSALGTLQ